MSGCQALSQSGRKCGSKVRLLAVNYHGDNELYGFASSRKEPSWVRVYLCQKHRQKKGRKP